MKVMTVLKASFILDMSWMTLIWKFLLVRTLSCNLAPLTMISHRAR